MADISTTVRVNGYSDLIRTLNYIGGDFKRTVKDEIRKVGEATRDDAAATAAEKGWSARTVSGYRVVVRQRGVAVEQSRRRTTGKQRKYGGEQMVKALIPARDRNVDESRKQMEAALQRVIDRYT